MELVRSRGSSFGSSGSVISSGSSSSCSTEGPRQTKRLEWHIFEPSSIYDDQVTRYIYELQCFVLECTAVAERHKVVILEQTNKINDLEAYLEGKANLLDWNQFDCINFQPLTFAFPEAPNNRPSEKVLRQERVEVVAYIDVLESEACKSMRHMETLAQELKFFADLVEKLNEEVWSLDVSGEMQRASTPRATPAEKKRRRISLLRSHPSKRFSFLLCLPRLHKQV